MTGYLTLPIKLMKITLGLSRKRGNYLKEGYALVSDQHFSIKYFLKKACATE